MRTRYLLIFVALVWALHAASPPAQPAVSPDEALARLAAGNARFRDGAPSRPNQDAARRVETATHGQQPFAIVLSCSDSRVPAEVVFDQGIGDLFVIRVAGNVAAGNETASVEYGAKHLGATVCVVLGHTSCGAVKAALDGARLEGDLAKLIAEVAPAAERTKKAAPSLTGDALLTAAVETNVWLSIENLFHRSEVLRARVASGELRVVGAVYDLATGEVRWLGVHPDQKRLLGG
ncbi:MAG TPA: carbonic anhydrase [Opitutaceae bacterium]|nr:carbonic anhydrase [Opitutaceae bacterium]